LAVEEFVTAVVMSAFGLEGFVKIRPLSGETSHLLGRKYFTLRIKGQKKRCAVEASRRLSGALALVKFSGVDNPESAALLKGAEIIVPRSEAAPLAEGEFYIEDLKGLKVVDARGVELGVIDGVIEGGGGDLVSVVLPCAAVRLVPFRNEFFGAVSIKEGWAEILSPWILD
jgi:16S rRNA processing protein RimM